MSDNDFFIKKAILLNVNASAMPGVASYAPTVRPSKLFVKIPVF
jgi:hypothetical protein